MSNVSEQPKWLRAMNLKLYKTGLETENNKLAV